MQIPAISGPTNDRFVNIGSEMEQIEYKKSIGELKEAIFSIAIILNKHQKGELYFGVESYVVGNQRPIRRNPLIARTLYYSKDMESFATGLKRIKDACDKAGCKVEFETPEDGFVVVFYRYGSQKLSGFAQKTAQKEEKTAQKEERINALLEYCKKPRDREEMMKFLGIKHRTTFRSDYLNPLLDERKIAMTIPDKPRSKNQKFYSL